MRNSVPQNWYCFRSALFVFVACLVTPVFVGPAWSQDGSRCEAMAARVQDAFDNPPRPIPGQQVRQSVPDEVIRWYFEYESAQNEGRPCPPISFTWAQTDQSTVKTISVESIMPEDVHSVFDEAALELMEDGAFEAAYNSANATCLAESNQQATACFSTGWMKEKGYGATLSLKLSRDDYLQACRLGSESGCDALERFMYFGMGGKRDLWRASNYAKDLCASGDGQACANYHMAVLYHSESVGEPRTSMAAEYFAYWCLQTPSNSAACSNLAVMHFDPRYGMEDEALAKRFAVMACDAEAVDAACRISSNIEYMENARKLSSRYTNQKGGIDTFLADLARGIAAANAMGTPYTATSMDSSPTLSDTNLTIQDWRDFNAAIQATTNIGTGFNSNCNSSNDYC